MPLPKSKHAKITCRVEELLPNFILVSYRSGSKVFRGVLIDEHCSQVKRVISPALYPVKQKLQAHQRLLNPKPPTAAKSRCQSLRSHVPEPNCIVLDNVDFVETGKSPIDSIRGLVERIDHDLIVPPSSAVTTDGDDLPFSKFSAAYRNDIKGAAAKAYRSLEKQRTDKRNGGIARRDSLSHTKRLEEMLAVTSSLVQAPAVATDSTPSITRVCPLLRKRPECNDPKLRSDSDGKLAFKVEESERKLSTSKPLSSLENSSTISQTTSSEKANIPTRRNKTDFNQNSWDTNNVSKVLHECHTSTLSSRPSKLSLFTDAPTEPLRERLSKERNNKLHSRKATDKIERKKLADVQRKIHNTRFKGSKSVISLSRKANSKEDVKSDSVEDASSKGSSRVVSTGNNEIAKYDKSIEDVELVASPLQRKSRNAELGCKQELRLSLKGSRKRKSNVLDAECEGEKSPSHTAEVSTEVDCLPSAAELSNDDVAPELRPLKSKSQTTIKHPTQSPKKDNSQSKTVKRSSGHWRRSSLRDKELVSFTTSQKAKTIPTYAKPVNSEAGSEDDIPIFALGDVVWGKVHGHPWWPGKVLSICDTKKNSLPTERSYQISWFGSNTVSVMEAEHLLSFPSHFHSKLTKRRYGNYRVAVKQALTACKLKD